MRSPTTIFGRGAWVEVILALSILTACNSDRLTSAPSGRPDGQPSTIDIAYCTESRPDWVAFQDGDGPWTQIEPVVAGGTVTFRYGFTTNRGTVAAVRRFRNGLSALSVQYALPAELPFLGDTNPAHCGPVIAKTLLGTVAGTDASDFVSINAGFGSRDFVAPGASDFAIGRLLSGPQEILATRTARVNDSNVLTGIILRRTPELPDSALLSVFDFNAAEAFAPVVANVRVSGLGQDGGITSTRLRTSHSESNISFFTTSPFLVTRPYDALPESRLEAGDLQVLSVTATPSQVASFRSATMYFRSPVDQTLPLGAPATMPAFSTVATTPSLRLRARFDNPPDYDRLTGISYQQGQNTIVGVAMTTAYAALGSAGYDLIIPDLSAAAGFDPNWLLRPNDAVFWIATRIGGTLGLGQNAVPTNGATVRAATIFDSFVP